MTLNDLKKLVTGPVLINLDRIITPKLVTLFYLFGLAGIGLWAMNHFFFSFRFGFGNGLWGILEIVIFGTLAFILLRATCEIALVFFKTNEETVARHNQQKRLVSSPTLIEDVREAIEDLAKDDDTGATVPTQTAPAPKSTTSRRPAAKRAATKSATTTKPTTTKRATPRRTAKRSPTSSNT